MERQVRKCLREIRDVKMLEENCLGFLQASRLALVQATVGAEDEGDGDGGDGEGDGEEGGAPAERDFGWGAVVSFKKAGEKSKGKKGTTAPRRRFS